MAIRLREQSCCSAETGTLVFAIINVIAVSAAALSSVAGLIYWAVMSFVAISTPTDSWSRDIPEFSGPYALIIGGSLVGVTMCAMIALVFAVFLVHGIVKKRPEHIKAYFVYGVVVTIVCLLATGAMMIGAIAFNSAPDIEVVVATLFSCLAYALILCMIRVAYKKLEVINHQFNHKPLQSEKC